MRCLPGSAADSAVATLSCSECNRGLWANSVYALQSTRPIAQTTVQYARKTLSAYCLSQSGWHNVGASPVLKEMS